LSLKLAQNGYHFITAIAAIVAATRNARLDRLRHRQQSVQEYFNFSLTQSG